MSSNYQVLCLSHDPAMTVGDDYSSPNDALAAAANPGQHEQLAAHSNCDLLVGRYSYPLIEAACPGGDRCKPGYHRHDADTWTQAGWLRLLYAAYTRGEDVRGYELPFCWTEQRVLRLRRELGIEPTPEPQ